MSRVATVPWTATVTELPDHADVELEVVRATVELDEAHAPYATATIVVQIPADPALVDPRERPRLAVTTTQTIAGQAPRTRSYDLLIHEARADAETGELTITAVSEEALLIDLAHVATTAEHRPGLDVPTFVEWALSLVDATLTTSTPGTLPSEPAEATVTNLLPNGALGTNATGWSAASGNQSIARVAGATPNAAAFIRATRVSDGNGGCYWSGARPAVVAGQRYTFSALARASSPREGFTIRIRWFDAGGSQISETISAAALVTTDWTRYRVTGVAPAAAVSAYVMTLAPSVTGQTLDVAELTFNEGAAADFVAGSLLDTAVYDYAWTSTPDASTSTRTWKPNSRAAKIEPGTALWDWLAPILSASGLRLYCDEARDWHLVPAVHDLDGLVQVSGARTAIGAQDSISLREDYCDSVVVRYRWRDDEGKQLEAYDVAGAGGRTKVITYETAYPGPGAAAGILERAVGRGHAQLLTVLLDVDATPGRTVASHVAGIPPQVGKIAAVAFTDATMTIRTRGLIDTPNTAWVLAEGTWEDQTETWADYSGPGGS